MWHFTHVTMKMPRIFAELCKRLHASRSFETISQHTALFVLLYRKQQECSDETSRHYEADNTEPARIGFTGNEFTNCPLYGEILI
jgi:hypothetical protein